VALAFPFVMTGSVSADYDFIQIDVPGASDSWAVGINDVGQIVGIYTTGLRHHGFVMDSDGQFRTIDVPGSMDTYANGINNAGQIVGFYCDDFFPYHFHGFVLKDNQFMVIDAPGAMDTEVYGINDAG
jgi:uncharacterized membrane protein